MVRKKHKCKKCGKLFALNGLVNVKGYGLLCYGCRQATPEYKACRELLTTKNILAFFGIKNKNKGEKTKE